MEVVSERPWKIDEYCLITNEEGKYIANLVDKEDAEHIVHCVNLHDELAKALEEAIGLILGYNVDELTEEPERIDDLRQLLQRAKGGQP